LALLLAIGSLPLEIAPAEAARIKFRFRSHAAAKHADKVDENAGGQTRSPIRIRIGRGSSSNSASAQDEKARPRPVGAAAAAAARAQAALEAEKAKSGPGSVRVYEPVPAGKTTDYSGGVTCVAGC
jgi:hypothetical protein